MNWEVIKDRIQEEIMSKMYHAPTSLPLSFNEAQKRSLSAASDISRIISLELVKDKERSIIESNQRKGFDFDTSLQYWGLSKIELETFISKGLPVLDLGNGVVTLNIEKTNRWFIENGINHNRPFDIFNSRKNDNKQDHIYLMIDRGTGYHKIGRSINPIVRERTLQSEKPTIEMLFYVKSQTKVERELHEKYKDKRVRGEWFDLSIDDIQEIKNYLHVK